jgi:hypothetical protein
VTWNYRVVRRRGTLTPQEDWEVLGIHEVHYDEAGKPTSVTVEPVTVLTDGTDVEALRAVLSMMELACGAPILEYDEICNP